MIHEGMGIARGRAKVRFGGNKGTRGRAHPGRRLRAAGRHRPSMPVGEPRPGGDRRLSQDRQVRSLPRQQGRTRARRLQTIPQVPLPQSDPVFGKQGPLLRLWHALDASGVPHVVIRLDRVLGQQAFDLRQRPPRGRAFPAHRRGHPRPIAPEGGVMLDYGCGEALSADRVAEAGVAADPVRAGAERAR